MGSGRPKSSGKYHRLDVEFDGTEPRLDDASSIPDLQHRAACDTAALAVIDNIAHCAVASVFYFEWDKKPLTIKDKYVGSGSIFCKFRGHEPVLKDLLAQLSSNSARFGLGDRYIKGTNDRTWTDKEGNFRLEFHLTVGDTFAIYLHVGSSKTHISGSPYRQARVEEAQGLNAHFGRADHRKRQIPDDFTQSPSKKRRTSFLGRQWK